MTKKNDQDDMFQDVPLEQDTTDQSDHSDSHSENLPEMTLSNHLLELRKRLLLCFACFGGLFAILFPFSESLFGFLVDPLADILGNTKTERRLIYTGLPEAFLTNIKVTLFFAFCASTPFIAYHLSRFVLPGLYSTEKKIFSAFVITAPVLFAVGALFSFYFVIPKAWSFFLSYESTGMTTGLPIQLEARVSEYLSMTLQMMIAFGLCFQLPLILVILAKFGIISSKTLSSKRRYAFIIILILSAILTPPDVFSMVALATPIYCLYELSIFVVRFTKSKK